MAKQTDLGGAPSAGFKNRTVQIAEASSLSDDSSSVSDSPSPPPLPHLLLLILPI